MAIDPLKPNAPASLTRRVPAATAADAAPSARGVFGADQATLTSNGAPLDLAGLSDEEIGLVKEGFLPADFATLRRVQREGGTKAAKAFYREGKQGPFEGRFGDPNVMLDAARRFSQNPELGRFAKSIRPGDIVMVTYNKTDDVIAQATKGPFVHALVCTKAGPPQEFIEAVGMTGDVNDPNSNKVLKSMASTIGYKDQTYRVLRPTANMAPHEAEKAIRRAIAYCENQLGKPYDFAFTDTNGQGMNDAYYCSELAYKAYADPKGADMPFEISKSADRDRVLGALASVLDGLEPDDQGALTMAAAKLGMSKTTTEQQLLDFVVNQFAPGTEATRGIADTPERRAALEATVKRVLAGKAFDRTEQALQTLTDGGKDGRYKGLGGFFRRVGDGVKLGVEGLKDVRELTKGVGLFRSLGVAWKLTHTIVPHAETLANHFFGPDDARTQGARRVLDQLDGLARDARRVPLLGNLWPLPSRPRPAENRDFVSPTDLGWANVAHEDFNVKSHYPVDQAMVEKKQAEIG